MSAEEQITPKDAQALLDRDQLNRVSRLTKGGLLSESERKRLKRIIKRVRVPITAAKGKREQTRAIDPKSFEGTFSQKQRRTKVYTMRLLGYSVREMAAELGAGQQTVINDLRAIEKALCETLDATHASAILNETLADLEAGRAIALHGIRESEGNEKIGYLNTATKISEVRISLLQDAGVLPKATQRHAHEGSDGGPIPVTLVQPRVRLQLLTNAESEKAMRLMNADATS
jgi:transposase